MEVDVVISVAKTHSEQKIHTPRARSIREIVFGVNDGLVSITGLIVGVTASRMSSHHSLLAGLAAVMAATVAMGLGAYLSTAAQNEYFMSERHRELREVHEVPDEERLEVEGIYRAQGFSHDLVKSLTEHITADKERWVDFMMKEELGIMIENLDNAWVSAGIMALAVIVGSIPPIAPYIIIPNPHVAIIWAIALAMLTAFGLGTAKALVAKTSWWKSGIQFVVVAAIAVVVGITAGHILSRII
ncbi:MAG: VIT1/CCC1 transporter family protein [Firmicutes bacterium]|nr:VIT1/CCC1 transporter family protein [Bacillota bacterium]